MEAEGGEEEDTRSACPGCLKILEAWLRGMYLEIEARLALSTRLTAAC